MTNRRFDFIGTILSRTSQGERPVPANNQEDLEVAATGRAPGGGHRARAGHSAGAPGILGQADAAGDRHQREVGRGSAG
jgi:hypothetical protein